MTLSGSGRTELNIKVHKEQIQKTENIYFAWNKKYGWLSAEYKKLKEDLAAVATLKVITRPAQNDTRTIRPFPVTSNEVIGWIAAKPDFRLEKFGPDCFRYPLDPPPDPAPDTN